MRETNAKKASKAKIAEDLAGIDLTGGVFYHRLARDTAKRSACGEEPFGGFRLISEEEYLKHPCPDCRRREK